MNWRVLNCASGIGTYIGDDFREETNNCRQQKRQLVVSDSVAAALAAKQAEPTLMV